MLRKFMTFIVLVAMMRSLHAEQELDEFDAVLQAPFLADGNGERVVRMHFIVPPDARLVRWREDVPKGVYRMRLLASLDGGGEVEQVWPVAVTTSVQTPASTRTRRTETLIGTTPSHPADTLSVATSGRAAGIADGVTPGSPAALAAATYDTPTPTSTASIS